MGVTNKKFLLAGSVQGTYVLLAKHSLRCLDVLVKSKCYGDICTERNRSYHENLAFSQKKR